MALEYATVGWNVAAVAIVFRAAFSARSVALVGFGLDSFIEIFASIVVVWQLTGSSKQRQRRALSLIGVAFFALATYLLLQTVYVIAMRSHPQPSPAGILWLTLTVIAMLGLAYGKRSIGSELQNPVLSAEARVTFVDALLAFAVLVGLALNSLAHWWWADPAAGLVIVFYGIREGMHARNAVRDVPGRLPAVSTTTR